MGLVSAIGAGIGAIGSALGASSSNRASRRAAQTSADNNAANIALARDIYGQNRQTMSPFVNRGNAAGNQINALLGLGGSQEMGGPTTMQMPNALAQFSDVGLPYGLGDNFVTTGAVGGGMVMPGIVTGYGSGTFNPDGTQVTVGRDGTPSGQTPQQAAQSAFDLFRNSTGYQNRFNSAMEGVTGAYSGIGAFQSGAAARALQDRAGQVAGEEFANYANMLGGQQAVGAGSASALAGVGQNFAGTVIGANNFNAQNQMSAQLGRQNPLANFAGVLGGGLFSYGMGG